MRDCPKYDFHIHTRYLGCGNSSMEVQAIVDECRRLGVRALGITDHLTGLEHLPKHRPILEDIRRLENPGVEVYFGVEVHFTGYCKGFPFSEEIKKDYGFQFAIGGIHNIYANEYDVEKIIEIQHKHHILTCEDPLVDVLVHPYWFMKSEFDNNNWKFIDTMKVVPERYIRELGQTARETGTAIEINADMVRTGSYSGEYVKDYVEYLSILAEEGVTFSLGSDAHDIRALARVRSAWEVAEELGISAERIWLPACAPMKS